MPAPDLVTAELTLTLITTVSDATFLGSIGGAAVVYKPIAGEQPLWDFPGEYLAHREMRNSTASTLSAKDCRVNWAETWQSFPDDDKTNADGTCVRR